MVKVAFDVTPMWAPYSGIRRYVRSLLGEFRLQTACRFKRIDGLGLLEPDKECRSADGQEDWTPGGMKTARLRLLHSLIGNAYAVQRCAPQVYWGPAHRFPIRLPPRIRTVLTVHDLCWLRAPATMRRTTRYLDKFLMKEAIARADAVLTVSKAVAEDVSEVWPMVRDRVHITHLAAAPQSHESIGEPRGECAESYFLFVGTHEPRKNLYSLLAAYAKAGRGESDWPRLVICGRAGWGSIDPASEARRLGIGSRVQMIGDVSDAQLAVLYRNALCLVMPSLYEGFGLPLVEAMSQGRPVLTSNLGAMREVAGDAGLLVDPYSTDSIAAGLRVMATDLNFRESLATHALTRAGVFSWAQTASKTWTVLTGEVI